MNEIEKKLVSEFVTNAIEIDRLCDCQNEIKAKLIQQAPHKVGDVVKWTETGRKKNVGTWLNPKMIDLKDCERKAIVRKVRADIWVFKKELRSFDYSYEFVALKKDGTIGVNCLYVPEGYEWTGEHFDIQSK